MRFIFQGVGWLTAGLLLLPPRARAAEPAPARTPVIRSWGTEKGLPQNTVTAITQTRDGYLWLGTHDGLARFDGVRFEPFGLEHGLQSVDITTLLEDRAGTLWVGTYGGGLGRWHEGRIETIPHAGHQPGLASINCLAEDAAGRLWVGTRAWRRSIIFSFAACCWITRARCGLARRRKAC
jgi:ligand-binding sensor domain-containing protein